MLVIKVLDRSEYRNLVVVGYKYQPPKKDAA